jgi:hypothetical protein
MIVHLKEAPYQKEVGDSFSGVKNHSLEQHLNPESG